MNGHGGGTARELRANEDVLTFAKLVVVRRKLDQMEFHVDVGDHASSTAMCVTVLSFIAKQNEGFRRVPLLRCSRHYPWVIPFAVTTVRKDVNARSKTYCGSENQYPRPLW